ncbi:MAG TPA: ATP-dependent metallopeptidase FtsH/Yme1/Tma family protein, partial [Actinomycetes bacterium]|nr:ATP-dependent metallopeptidase FtsH/Yme1/Tma family protein [Actinomycetes bacterium]
MDVKRYFRGPFFWVALVIIGVLLVTSISSAAGGFKKVDTSQAINAINAGKVAQAKIVDRDQRLELTLKDGVKIDGAGKVQTDYVQARQREIVDDLVKTPPPQGYTDSVPRTSWLVTL